MNVRNSHGLVRKNLSGMFSTGVQGINTFSFLVVLCVETPEAFGPLLRGRLLLLDRSIPRPRQSRRYPAFLAGQALQRGVPQRGRGTSTDRPAGPECRCDLPLPNAGRKGAQGQNCDMPESPLLTENVPRELHPLLR